MKEALPPEIFFIATGGTIDAEAYPVENGTVKPPENATMLPQSQIPATVNHMMAEMEMENGFLFQQLEMRDSKNFSEPDIDAIARLIEARRDTNDIFVITHGTDRMMQSARYLNQFLHERDLQDKTVIFTGAMVPLQNSDISDGWTNVKGILEHIRDGTAPKGVHVFMDPKAYEIGALTEPQFLNPLEYEKDVPNSCFVRIERPHSLMTPYTWSIEVSSGKPMRFTPWHNDV